tara:strand:- start:1286 stop:1405 length:120 start_codon:yes stop_codon:yes gene_type:complete
MLTIDGNTFFSMGARLGSIGGGFDAKLLVEANKERVSKQ